MKFRLIEESIIAKELAYEVERSLIAKHSRLKELVTNKDKLFMLKY